MFVPVFIFNCVVLLS